MLLTLCFSIRAKLRHIHYIACLPPLPAFIMVYYYAINIAYYYYTLTPLLLQVVNLLTLYAFSPTFCDATPTLHYTPTIVCFFTLLPVTPLLHTTPCHIYTHIYEDMFVITTILRDTLTPHVMLLPRQEPLLFYAIYAASCCHYGYIVTP